MPSGVEVRPGQFVIVPLGPVERLGVVWHRGEGGEPKVERKKLREIIEVLDDVPALPRVSLDFADWVARYTLSSPGMVLRMMMSAGHAFSPPKLHYGVRLEGPPPQRITPARGRVLEVAANGMTWMKSALAETAGVSPGVIDGLVDAGTLITEELPAWAPPRLDLSTARARLTPEQAAAADGTPRQHAATASSSPCSTASPAPARPRSISRRSRQPSPKASRRSCSCPRSR